MNRTMEIYKITVIITCFTTIREAIIQQKDIRDEDKKVSDTSS